MDFIGGVDYGATLVGGELYNITNSGLDDALKHLHL